jgi:choline dehydrogenase-like flavoprotein
VVTNIFQRGSRRLSENGTSLVDSPAVQLIHDATVRGFVPVASGGRIDHLDVVADQGRRFSVAARRFVLAAGGIENPRLLLASPIPDREAAVGNERDLVGRFFMERLSARAGVIVPSDPRLPVAASLYRSHLVDGTRVQGVLSLAPDVVRREGLRNAAFWVPGRRHASSAPGVGSVLSVYRHARRRPRDLGAIGRHLVNIGRDLPDVVRTAAHHVLRRPESAPDVFQLGVQAEQAPNPDSRVTLARRSDRFGMPLARLDWQPSTDDRRSIQRTVQLLDGALREAGIGRIVHPFGTGQPPALFLGNWHHMGTTRMHDDPAHGVVDRTGRLHTMDNLYVAGSSVFPTTGFANPTLTIVALAVRLADELRRGGWGDSAS